ncbi:hypothetical protein Y11_02791 [Yersinia enterocolitica subsp. palearctica Y11]|uniref:Uncharacterized protein n=1 Tax=Yersinia enterocolitica subsp. palearctica serotype O:3 (strain DSM 13030 / CIP 106945 / Y11) TaxID=930944 RepID=A0A0H3NS08_YERE1|nr:hypothetical protein Y11_02791 [Yersinia enterocolitica subsp. palearctica Y11]CCO67412.1 hypothetical protein D322_516 [Yersinia enterocolitica IP 10393]
MHRLKLVLGYYLNSVVFQQVKGHPLKPTKAHSIELTR